jgi:hypothetical protein
LMEADGDVHTEAILHGWRELAREERWWLFAKAASPGQRQGVGWRVALFHALSETSDSRADRQEATEKKSPGNCLSKVRRLPVKKEVPKSQKQVRKAVSNPKTGKVSTEDKKNLKNPTAKKTKMATKNQPEKTKKVTSRTPPVS